MADVLPSRRHGRFVGLQRVEGVAGEKVGAFVAETVGNFDGGKATGEWTIVTGSGEGDLVGIQGTGTFEAPQGSIAQFSVEYTIV